MKEESALEYDDDLTLDLQQARRLAWAEMEHPHEAVADVVLDLGKDADFQAVAAATAVPIERIRKLYGRQGFWRLVRTRAIARGFGLDRAVQCARVIHHAYFKELTDRIARGELQDVASRADLLAEMKELWGAVEKAAKVETMLLLYKRGGMDDRHRNVREDMDALLQSEGGRFFLEKEAERGNPDAIRLLENKPVDTGDIPSALLPTLEEHED